jgi:hypothetical protein
VSDTKPTTIKIDDREFEIPIHCEECRFYETWEDKDYESSHVEKQCNCNAMDDDDKNFDDLIEEMAIKCFFDPLPRRCPIRKMCELLEIEITEPPIPDDIKNETELLNTKEDDVPF